LYGKPKFRIFIGICKVIYETEFLMATTYGMTTPIMSSVMTNPMTTTNTVSSMGVQGLPMSSALPIIVNESTPNLAEIQSFPVVVRNGGIHIHQDPVTGQRYRMTDEFHSRIPQILAGNSSTIGMTGGVMSVASVETATITNNRIGSVNTSPSVGVQGISRSVIRDVNSISKVTSLPNIFFEGMQTELVGTSNSTTLSSNQIESIKVIYSSNEDISQLNIESLLASDRTNFLDIADNDVSISVMPREIITGGVMTMGTMSGGRYVYPSVRKSDSTINRSNMVLSVSVNRYSYPKV
jgi:hypothetical protein